MSFDISAFGNLFFGEKLWRRKNETNLTESFCRDANRVTNDSFFMKLIPVARAEDQISAGEGKAQTRAGSGSGSISTFSFI
jgi:hypothetical protein